METLLDYRLEDFLLFSPDVYWRLFELHNARFAYLIPACLLAAALMVASAFARVLRPALFTAAAAAALSAWAFFLESYATINWAAPWIAPLFLALAALLMAIAVRHRCHVPHPARKLAAILLLVHGAAVYPVQGLLFGRPVEGAEILGLAPDPTAIAILGLLALTKGGFLTSLAALSALVWCGMGALTLYTMDQADAWPLFIAAALGAIAIPWRRET